MLGMRINARIQKILADIGLEVIRAKQQWGEESDRKNTQNDWACYVNRYLVKADESATFEEVETNLRKAAGLIVSAIDMLQREGFASRHYDGQTRLPSLPEIK